MDAGTPKRGHVSLDVMLLYGAPSLAGAAMLVPIYIHLPKFYSDVVGVPLGFLAIAIAGARALDALSDPLVGWLSDRTRGRFGRRRPYIAVGAPLCALAFFALFSPPARLAGIGAAGWFTSAFILYFLFHTLYALPHYALGPELTQDYHERSRLFGFREAFSILGTIAASIAPGVLISAGLSERRAFAAMGAVFAILLAALSWLLVARVRERAEYSARAPNPFVPGVRRALRNRPFRILLASYVVSSTAGAIPGTLMPFFNAYVIRPENVAGWLAIFLGVYFGAGFLFMPAWLWLARRVGKRAAWLASFGFGISGGVGMFFLGRGDTLPLLFLIAWSGSAFGAGLFLGPSIQADVIDYDELHTGRRREAQYTAFWAMLPKFVAIPSAAIPIAILASLGYVPNAEQPPQVVLAIRTIFALVPAFFSTLAFLVARRFPIDERVHNAVLRGIEQHAGGEDAVDPLTGALVPPPRSGAVDEETGWFLDHFSPPELETFLARGARPFLRRVGLAALVSLAVCFGAALLGADRVTDVREDPGAVAVLAIVASGFALALFGFHLVRLRAARRLAADPLPTDVLKSWLRGRS
jgi:GPH family glycoside/pentoside/hexuronide:cation symporter